MVLPEIDVDFLSLPRVFPRKRRSSCSFGKETYHLWQLSLMEGYFLSFWSTIVWLSSCRRRRSYSPPPSRSSRRRSYSKYLFILFQLFVHWTSHRVV